MQGNAVTGAGYFFRGLAMLPTPGIRLFVVIPVAANISVFLLLGSLLWRYVAELLLLIESVVPEWLAFVNWVISPLLWIATSLLIGYVATFIVLLATSPFLSLLAEKVEEQLTSRPVQTLQGLGAAVKEIPRSLMRELGKLAYYIPRALFVMVVSFVPGLNTITPVLWFILGAWMMSLHFIDYPMDNHRLGLTDVREACAAHRMSSLGFGGVVAFATGVPLVNMVVIPAAVVGATLLWCDELRDSVHGSA